MNKYLNLKKLCSILYFRFAAKIFYYLYIKSYYVIHGAPFLRTSVVKKS